MRKMLVSRLEGSLADVSLLETLKSLNLAPKCCSSSQRYSPFFVSCFHTKYIEFVFTPSSVEPFSPHPRLVWNMFAS